MHSTHASSDMALASELHESEQLQDDDATTSTSSEDKGSAEKAELSTSNNPRQSSNNSEQLLESNQKAQKAIAEDFKKLEVLKKDLAKAEKDKDAKKIAQIKKDYTEIKKSLQQQSDDLEDREYPDGRNSIPLSEAGKKVQEDLIKAAKVQKKIEDALKPMTEEKLAKMQKEKDALDADKLLGATAATTVGALAGIISPSLAPLAAAATQAAISSRQQAEVEVPAKPATQNSPTSGSHVQKPANYVELPKESENAANNSFTSRLLRGEMPLTLDSGASKTEIKKPDNYVELPKEPQSNSLVSNILKDTSDTINSDKDAGKIDQINNDLSYILDELSYDQGELSAKDIADKQYKTYQLIEDLRKLQQNGSGRNNSAKYNEALKNAVAVANNVRRVLDEKNNPIAFSPNDTLLHPPQTPNRIGETHGSNSFATNDFSNVDNERHNKPAQPEPYSFDWFSQKIKDSVASVGDYVSNAYNKLSDTPSSHNSYTENYNNYEPSYTPDPIVKTGSGSIVPQQSSVTPTQPSTPTPTQIQTPSTASTPTTPPVGRPLSSGNPNLLTQGNPTQAIAGGGGIAEAKAGSPQELLARRGIGNVPLENSANHISPYESTDRPISDLPSTSISNTAGSVGQRNSQRDADTAKNLNLRPVARETSTSPEVSYPTRDTNGVRRNNSYSSDSQSVKNSNVTSTNEVNTTWASSQSQNGMPQTQSQQQQNASQNANNPSAINNQQANAAEQSVGSGVTRLRRTEDGNGNVVGYGGIEKLGNSLFTSQNDLPTPDKAANKNNFEPKKAAVESAYSPIASGTDSEPKKTVREEVADAVKEDERKNAEGLKGLINKDALVEEVVNDTTDAGKENENSTLGKVTLANFDDIFESSPKKEDLNNRIIASNKIANQKAKAAQKQAQPPLSSIAQDAGNQPASEPQSLLGKILSLFGV